MTDPSAAARSEAIAPTGLTRFARRGLHRLAYEVVPATAPEAPTVLLLHGLLAGRGEWATPREALAGAYELVLPEARGHGASAALAQARPGAEDAGDGRGAPNRRYAVADLAADTLAVLDAVNGHPAHVVGHGLGGLAAWELARLAPDRLRSLTLVEPDLAAVLDGDPDPVAGSLRREARQADRAAAEAAYRGRTDQALAAYLGPRRGSDWHDRLTRQELATVRRHAAALAGLLPALDAHAWVPGAVPVPTLIVHGAAARPLVRLICERLAATTQGARLATVPTAAPTDSPLAGPAGVALGTLLRSFFAAEIYPGSA